MPKGHPKPPAERIKEALKTIETEVRSLLTKNPVEAAALHKAYDLGRAAGRQEVIDALTQMKPERKLPPDYSPYKSKK